MPSGSQVRDWFSRTARTHAPGILVAATGVGAGDLMTASIVGSEAGTVILWAVLLGAVLKLAVTDGIARWQMATTTTLLEGWVEHLGRWIQIVFVGYLLVWSFVVGGALVTACGVAVASIWVQLQLPLPAEGDQGVVLLKVIGGVVHSLLGIGLVWWGGYRLFERVMSVFVTLMFFTVVATTVMIGPDWSAAATGLFIPKIPAQGFGHVLALVGGVGGTVTVLCYGYWIREEGRNGVEGYRTCRVDLSVAYALTALFGICMVLIGSRIHLEGKGAALASQLAAELAASLGTGGSIASWLFLIGFWGAVFSSLLGVWQGIPYLFADFLAIRTGRTAAARDKIDLTNSKAYRGYLIALALVPLLLLGTSVRPLQIVNAVLGACFMPLLALTLLILNNQRRWVGEELRNGRLINAILMFTVALFTIAGGLELYRLVTNS